MKPAPHERRHPARAPAAHEAGRGGRLERVAGALLAAVIVCRLLTPTDAAAVGETIWIAQFALLGLLVWNFAAYRAGQLRVAFDWIDAAGWLLCLGHIVGALIVVSTSGDKRAALNMLWEWCGVEMTMSAPTICPRHSSHPAASIQSKA
ncbi:MAG: hypothetical protein ACM3U2_05655, partial [Deltaproteobacteria bacterium]